MKIVYCIAGTRHSGGMERVLANKANWLAGRGHEVVIITTDQNGEPPFFKLDDTIVTYDLGINYEENNGKSFLNKLLNYPAKQWRHYRRLSKLLRQLKADVVVSMFCNDASFIHRIKDGSRKILEIHFSRFKRLQYGRRGLWGVADKLRSRRDLKTASKFDKFVVLTKEDSHNWKGLDNVVVIPNARTFEVAEPARLKNKTVIAVGRLCYQKGFDRLVEVWDKVASKVPDWKLEIIGGGEDEEKLRRDIESKGLKDRIIMRSAKSDEMPEIYKDASIYVMTSRYEGLPMALLEAQAAGLPIVSFDCKCGPKDIVTDGEDGYLVKEGDIDTMAQRLIRLITDEDLRMKMGTKAFRNSGRFSESAVMQQWLSLFNNV